MEKMYDNSVKQMHSLKKDTDYESVLVQVIFHISSIILPIVK